MDTKKWNSWNDEQKNTQRARWCARAHIELYPVIHHSRCSPSNGKTKLDVRYWWINGTTIFKSMELMVNVWRVRQHPSVLYRQSRIFDSHRILLDYKGDNGTVSRGRWSIKCRDKKVVMLEAYEFLGRRHIFSLWYRHQSPTQTCIPITPFK